MLSDALVRLRSHPHPDEMRDVLLDIANAFMERDDADVDASERRIFGDFIATALDRLGDDIKAMIAEAISDSNLVPPEAAARAARDPSPDVAKSFLTHSPVLDDSQLVELARTETEDRQIAIAQRDQVSAEVSDALITHGTDNVLVALSDNMRATYSQIGLARLLHRVGDNPLVQASLNRRSKEQAGFDRAILSSVDDALRDKLGDLLSVIDASAYQVVVRSAAEGITHAAGQELSDRMWRHSLMRKVKGGAMSFDAALSELCGAARLRDCMLALAERLGLPEDLVSSNFARPESDRLAILCRAAEVSDATYSAVSKLRLTITGQPTDTLQALVDEYASLDTAQARRAVRIVRLRAAELGDAAPESGAA